MFETVMSEKDFNRLSEFIERELGIKMPPAKKVLLESRLQKRLRALKLSTFSNYCDYLFTPKGMEDELVHMIDLVTTNKTDFFRESHHFDFLVNTAVPDLIRQSGGGIKKSLIIWSAGCSTGEEAYTISMVLTEFAERFPGLGFKFQVIATDISTRVLDIAKRAVFGEENIGPVPMHLRKKYILKSRDEEKMLVRMTPDLRSLVKFRRLNFMEGDFGFREPLDIIFCRNVMIYFDKATQAKLVSRFYDHLLPGGYLFIGHSETLNGVNVPFEKAGNAVYKKPD
jgi:chemotaxis protein methyltransferase CheR